MTGPLQPVGLRPNLLRRWDSGPYARAFSLNSRAIRLECAHICPRFPTTSPRFPKSDRLLGARAEYDVLLEQGLQYVAATLDNGRRRGMLELEGNELK